MGGWKPRPADSTVDRELGIGVSSVRYSEADPVPVIDANANNPTTTAHAMSVR